MDYRLILVTGATGKQGGAVARELLDGRYRIRAMTRNPDGEAAAALDERGVAVVRGDLDDAGSLRRVLDEAWGTYAVQNTWEAGVEREEEQGKRFATLAREMGVEHFVYASVGSAHRRTGIPHFENKWRIEETVRALGFPSHVILRPVFFMENLLASPTLEGIRQGTLALGIAPHTRLQMIAVEDIGKYGRMAYDQADALNGRALDIAGDELTMPEVAAILSEVTGREVVFQPVPIEQVRSFSTDLAAMFEWFDRVGYDVDIERLADESGIAPTRFADWARRQNWA